MFLSGWKGPDILPSQFWFLLKLVIVLIAIVWVRMSWPRLRIDQILELAWKGLFELTLINIVATAILVTIWPNPTMGEIWIMAGINWLVAIPSVIVVGKVLRRKNYRTIQPDGDSESYPVGTETLAPSLVNKVGEK